MPLCRFAGQNREGQKVQTIGVTPNCGHCEGVGGKLISVHTMQSVKLGLGSSVMKAVHMMRTCPPKPRTNTNLRSFQVKDTQCCGSLSLSLSLVVFFKFVIFWHLFIAFQTSAPQIGVRTQTCVSSGALHLLTDQNVIANMHENEHFPIN